MTKKTTLKLSALAMAGAMSFSLGGAYGLSVQLAVENIANEILESQTTDAKSMLTSYAQQLSNEIIKEGGALPDGSLLFEFNVDEVNAGSRIDKLDWVNSGDATEGDQTKYPDNEALVMSGTGNGNHVAEAGAIRLTFEDSDGTMAQIRAKKIFLAPNYEDLGTVYARDFSVLNCQTDILPDQGTAEGSSVDIVRVMLNGECAYRTDPRDFTPVSS